MKALRLTALVLPITLAGCLFTTGQFNIDVDLDDAFVSGTGVDREYVNLNTIQDYVDHKEDLAGIADIAVIGTAQNFTGSEIAVEAWITPDSTEHASAAAVRADTEAFQLWGPFSLAAGETKRITWDDSAALFDPVGKYVVLQQMQGDGTFTIYFLNANTGVLTAKAAGSATQGGADIELRNLSMILTIEGEE